MAGSPRSNGRPRARHQPSESQVANGRAWWRAEGERIWVEAVTGQSGQREAVLRSRRLKTVVTVSAGCVAAVAGVSGLGELLGPTPAGILALLAAGLSAVAAAVLSGSQDAQHGAALQAYTLVVQRAATFTLEALRESEGIVSRQYRSLIKLHEHATDLGSVAPVPVKINKREFQRAKTELRAYKRRPL